jgi:hypothetical protein
MKSKVTICWILTIAISIDWYDYEMNRSLDWFIQKAEFQRRNSYGIELFGEQRNDIRLIVVFALMNV